MAGPIHSLSGEQYEVLLQIVNYGETHGHNGEEILAAVEIGIVENRFHNTPSNEPGNHAVGWSQEEPEYGSVAERLDMSKSLPRVYNQLRALRGKYATSGEWAQAIQRSAYPLRYGEAEPLAKTLIKELGKNAAKPGMTFGPEPGHVTGVQQAVSTTNDPPDHSTKIRHAGQTLGATGTSFGGHANAMRRLSTRTLTLKSGR